MLIVTLMQVEFEQPCCSELAQYVVVITGGEVINGLPVPIKVLLQPEINHPVDEPEPPDVLKLMLLE